MAATQTVQTFAGIANENEFYSHHYLAEVFKGDIRTLIESWQATEEAAGQATATGVATEEPGRLIRQYACALQTAWRPGRKVVRDPRQSGRLREDAERLESHLSAA